MNVTIEEQYVLKTLQDLVRINSINPMLVPGSPAELEIGNYIKDQLREMHVDTKLCELGSGRVNVVAVIAGLGGGKSLMFNGHMDTVGVHGMRDPFSAEIRGGKLYGRGAQDMKSGLAAMLAAIKTIVDSSVRLKGDVILAAVADEEHGSIGTEALVKVCKADAAIVTEPTDLEICLAHKGFCVFEIETKGRAAHGGCYMDGIDANLHMGRILAELDKHSSQLHEGRKHPLLGSPSLLVPLVSGGTHQFVYPDKCTISLERRTIPGESSGEIEAGLQEILNKLASEDPRFNATIRTAMVRDPYEISPDSEIVKIVEAAAGQVLGRIPAHIGHPWWEDSALIAESGASTVIFGARGAGLHTTEEWVEIQSVMDLARILALSAINYCS